jgi:3-hydroxymyristoyl/3-hydroxydecanoyl-(acyl carrier protein) dehydratase
MSLIARETRQCLSRLTRDTGGTWAASFVFPPRYAGFRGHFPGDPVLPAVCMIEAALAVLSAAREAPVRLVGIPSAKWLAPVRPDEVLEVQVIADGDPCAATRPVKARITRGGARIADLSLMVAFADPAVPEPPP